MLFDASMFDELRKADPMTGAKPVVHAHARDILNVPIDDPGAYIDLDTPDQYEQFIRARPTR